MQHLQFQEWMKETFILFNIVKTGCWNSMDAAEDTGTPLLSDCSFRTTQIISDVAYIFGLLFSVIEMVISPLLIWWASGPLH